MLGPSAQASACALAERGGLRHLLARSAPLRGAPSGHTLPIREVRLSAGAGFVVAMAGEIMSMPGLPRVPAAEKPIKAYLVEMKRA